MPCRVFSFRGYTDYYSILLYYTYIRKSLIIMKRVFATACQKTKKQTWGRKVVVEWARKYVIYKVWKNGGKIRRRWWGVVDIFGVVNNTTLKREILWRQNLFLVVVRGINATFCTLLQRKTERNFQLKKVQ